MVSRCIQLGLNSRRSDNGRKHWQTLIQANHWHNNCIRSHTRTAKVNLGHLHPPNDACLSHYGGWTNEKPRHNWCAVCFAWFVERPIVEEKKWARKITSGQAIVRCYTLTVAEVDGRRLIQCNWRVASGQWVCVTGCIEWPHSEVWPHSKV